MKRALLMMMSTMVWASIAAAAEAPNDSAWAPPAPEKKQKDWVQLKSGEWLWGEITLFQDLEMDFDSDVLDDIKLDWEDVVYIRSARVLTWTFTQRRVVSGTAVMQDGNIRVRSEVTNQIHEFPRASLLKVIEGDVHEINYWSVKASLSTTIRTGNTNQTDVNTAVKIRRDATRSRVDISYNGNYSDVDSVQTVNNTSTSLGWGIIVTRGFFVTPFMADLYHDLFQNIELRATVGAGVGYYVVRNNKVEWNVQLGGAYRHTRNISVEAGQPDFNETGAVVPQTTFEWDITGDIELDVDYNGQIGVPDTKNTTHHLQAYFSVDVFNDILSLTSNFTWDRVASPVTTSDGVTPKPDDYRLAFGIGIDL